MIITKADLSDLADDAAGQVMLRAAGVEVVTTSAEHGDGLDELLAHKLQRELAALGRRHDAAAHRAYQREWRQTITAAGQNQRSAERYSHEKAEDRRGKGSGEAKVRGGRRTR